MLKRPDEESCYVLLIQEKIKRHFVEETIWPAVKVSPLKMEVS